jgi:hypothetical protein
MALLVASKAVNNKRANQAALPTARGTRTGKAD